MSVANTTEPIASGTSSYVRSALLVVGIALVALLVLWALPNAVISGDGIETLVIAALFLFFLCMTLASAHPQSTSSVASITRTTLFIWWCLLISEALFDHMGNTVRSLEGQFSPAAYGEGLIWLLSFLVVLLLSCGAPDYIGRLFHSSNKWISLFAMLCVVSALYSPSRLYALAWSFKLVLVVILLQLLSSTLKSVEDVILVLRTTVWGLFVLAIGELLYGLTNFQGSWKADRLGISPTELSPIAGCVLLLGMVMYSIERRKVYVFASMLGAIIMFLAFGKTGIVAGVLSTLLFYGLQKRLGTAFVLFAGLSALGVALVSFTPLATYLTDYDNSGQAYKFSGRTDVWVAAIPAIRSKLFLGHGYLASYFAWTFTNSALAKANHLHNSFLEVAYNNGIVGLFLIVVIQYVMVRNILASVRVARTLCEMHPNDSHYRYAYLLSIGCLALYFDLLMGGMFEPSFGARAMSLFMLFLALFVISDFLQRFLRSLPQAALQPAQAIS